MRVEATIPDSRGNAVTELAEELGLSRSQIVDEALALFLKAVIEIRRGRRLVTIEPGAAGPACEIATPTLSALEWAANPSKLEMPASAVAKIQELVESPPRPNRRLRRAMRRHVG